MERKQPDIWTLPRSADQATSLLAASQAIDWQTRLQKPTPTLRQQFLAWLQESPIHVREALLLMTLENDLRSLSLLGKPGSREPVDFSSYRSRWHRPFKVFKHGLGYVVVALLAMTIAWHFLYPTDADSAQNNSLVVPLADGSSITAGPDARVRVVFNNDAREVVLETGEASFDVAPSDERPFSVQADQLMVETVGGKFEIRRRGQWASVIVTEGNVVAGTVGSEMAHADALLAKTLVKGQQLSISDLQQVRDKRIRAALVMDAR